MKNFAMMSNYLKIALFLFCAFSYVMPLPLRAVLNPEKPYFILQDTMHSGFGAEFSAVLGALDAFNKRYYSGLEIKLDSGVYHDPAVGPNWWEYYFAPISLGNKSAKPHHSTKVECCALSSTAYNQLSRKRNNRLIQQYIKVRPDIQQIVDHYVRDNFKFDYVIGVHHRGTDKSNETNLVPWKLTLQVLQHTIENLPKRAFKHFKIYVATDDQHFLDYLLKHYPNNIIYGNFSRSIDNQPLHGYESEYYSGNYEKGKEAIVEALILSRCKLLIRPAASGFSWIPMVFSPEMPVNSIYSGGWVFPGKWSPPWK